MARAARVIDADAEAGEVPAPVSGTIVIASKLPHKVVLQLQVAEEHFEDIMGSSAKRKVTRWRKAGEIHEINGFARPVDKQSEVALSSGFALTFGIPADFWEAWLDQNKEWTPVKKGFVFAFERQSAVTSEARNRRAMTSGFEPVDPNNLPDEFRGDHGKDLITRAVTE
jgi:hypothetical protein